MTDKELQKQLETLQQVHAPLVLHAKIRQRTLALEDMHSGFYFPLFAFRTGLIVAILLVFILATSGVVVAGESSSKGSIFYPVKEVLQTLPIPKNEVTTPTPRIIPTITQKPTHMPFPTKAQEEKEKEQHNEHNVKGLSTSVDTPTQHPNHPIHKQEQDEKWLDFPNFFQHGKGNKSGN